MVTAILLFIDAAFITNAHSADSYNIRFSWDAVTTNENDTPCDDLAGYAIYRHRENVDALWLLETYERKAFKTIPANQTTTSVICTEGGKWFWIIRAFDTSGNYSFRSNVLMTDFDIVEPGTVLEFKIVSGGTF